MVSQARVFFEPIKTIAAAAIMSSYVNVGSATAYPIRGFKISNNTKGDMMFTIATSVDQIFVAAGAFTLYDLQSNINPKKDDSFVLPVGTQFKVKKITDPTSGDIYIECFY